MLSKRIIPCLLLQGDKLVKTEQFDNPRYVGDPLNTIKIFNELEVDEICVLDIFSRKPNFTLIQKLAENCFMPMSYGGGIKTIEDAEQLFKIGIEKVIINSQALANPMFIKKLSDRFGSQSVVVSIDTVRKLNGWNIAGTKTDVIEFMRIAESYGAGEFLLNSVNLEGKGTGLDYGLLEKALNSTNVPIIITGGVGKHYHIKRAFEIGASAVACGSAFVYQKVNSKSVLINYPTKVEKEWILNC